ncbi:calcineurin-like phosphoesterase family protein [Bosea sp. BK604]|nr:calcineurin-like phosphoesterase family protein [Bosea sp. BK604]
MRIWLFSDLHQEFDDQLWDPLPSAPTAGFDVVVVPGDVHMPLTRALAWLHERFSGLHVIYTPGNHDFWWDKGEERYTIWDQLQRGRELADRLGVSLLLDSSVVVGETRFLGGTLWTDLRLGTYSLHAALREAEKNMRDYRRIRRKPDQNKRLRPAETLRLHRATRDYISGAISMPWLGQTVVVTHHAPHPNSLADRSDPLAFCYASDLSSLIEFGAPALWVHGHVHRVSDYTVGLTRILANPRGHIEEQSGFNPSLCIDVR